MSNAYPGPGADEPAWRDTARWSRLDGRASRHRDTGELDDGNDCRPGAVAPAPHPWQANTTGDERHPSTWDGCARSDDRASRSAADHDIPPHPPPPLARDRAEASTSADPHPASQAPALEDPDVPTRRAPDEIEHAMPVTQRLRETVARLTAKVRASVPLRTALFVLPPLVLPALALDLSLRAAIVVSLLLLWLATAAGVVATLMFEGSDQLALRAIERRLDQLPAAGRAVDDEALLAVGAQLDALNDRLDELAAGRARSADPAAEHRPQEQWSTSEGAAQNDWYDHDVVTGRHWSPPRWER